MRTRCLENSVFAVTANRNGTEIRPRGKLVFTGQSQIISPKGHVIGRSGAQSEELVVREIDIHSAKDKSMTDNNDLFKDRRPEYYRALLDK